MNQKFERVTERHGEGISSRERIGASTRRLAATFSSRAVCRALFGYPGRRWDKAALPVRAVLFCVLCSTVNFHDALEAVPLWPADNDSVFKHRVFPRVRRTPRQKAIIVLQG
jgi:hypothetical protein